MFAYCSWFSVLFGGGGGGWEWKLYWVCVMFQYLIALTVYNLLKAICVCESVCACVCVFVSLCVRLHSHLGSRNLWFKVLL